MPCVDVAVEVLEISVLAREAEMDLVEHFAVCQMFQF